MEDRNDIAIISVLHLRSSILNTLPLLGHNPREHDHNLQSGND